MANPTPITITLYPQQRAESAKDTAHAMCKGCFFYLNPHCGVPARLLDTLSCDGIVWKAKISNT